MSKEIKVCSNCLGNGLDRHQPPGPVKPGKWKICPFCKGTGLPAPGDEGI